jgi:CMP-N,N'-diacetyllegionaminic acid synthase
MRILALIPARGGSKGIPRKNVRLLAGKPLIAWTIEAARACAELERVVVSTDDAEIASVAREHGAEIPFMRPEALATDSASSLPVVLHALDHLPGIDAVLLLQPTSPLRTAADIAAVLSLAASTGAPSVMSVAPAPCHPDWMYRMSGGRQLERLMPGRRALRRQDLEPVYVPNGAIYFNRVDWLRETGDFVGPGTIGFEMPAERSIDLDGPLDWALTELLLAEQIARQKGGAG